MSLVNPNYLKDDQFVGKDIQLGTSIYRYVATDNVKVIIDVWAKVVGGGTYEAWITHKWLGIGVAHETNPHIKIVVSDTDLSFKSRSFHLKKSDILNVWVKGLTGDDCVFGGIRIIADNISILETNDLIRLRESSRHRV